MDSPWYKRPSSLPLGIFLTALVIIIVGGSIRVLDAGESCPDWPRCFGQWTFDVSEEEQGIWYEENPDEIDSRGAEYRYTTLEIFVEWFHRLIASLISIPVLANFLLIRRKREIYGDHLVKVSFFTGILLIIQGIAGYTTVKFDNEDWTVALHLTLALSFLSILLWQWMLMRKKEGAKWSMLSVPANFVASEFKRFVSLTSAILLLLILGSWVASTAGGNYNQACSVGFPDGWPKCQGNWLPSFDGAGILVQMIHRFGAGIVGIALILGGMKIREKTREYDAPIGYSRCFDIATGFWLANIFVGGLYIVFAKTGDFPEGLSLVHLTIGIAGFLSAAIATMLLRISSYSDEQQVNESIIDVKIVEGSGEDE